MSETAPRSREALFVLLRELARADEVPPERLAAARESIRAGHLGAASEAVVEDRSGRAIPLLAWAATWNDREMAELLLERGAHVDAGDGAEGTALHAAASGDALGLVELLLARGASPLASRSTRESVLRAAHRHGPIFQLVRRAAKDAIERCGSARHGLATLPSDRRYALRTDRGVSDLRRAAEPLAVVLVESDVKTAARALGNLVRSPRREADVGSRPVQDARRLTFLYRLRGFEWTIIPFVFGEGSPWNVEHVTELSAPGAGMAPFARALASAVGRRVIHIEHTKHTIFHDHGGIDARTDEAELSELGVFVPPMRVGTDGYHVQLELFGVDAADVERVDLVVLQELGEPEVDRRIQLTSAPALVGAPTLAMPGLPPMVAQPPAASLGPPKSEAPPLVREPPPTVTQLGPAPSEAAPLSREAPPMLAVPEPPPSDERTAPPADEPPARAEPAPSEAPPLVREPPPIVASPPVAGEADSGAGDEPPDDEG